MLTSEKSRRPWYQKVSFLKLHFCVYLRAKFQVSSITLTSFRQGREGVIHSSSYRPTSKRTSKKPTQITVNKEDATISALSSTNIEYLTGEEILPLNRSQIIE